MHARFACRNGEILMQRVAFVSHIRCSAFVLLVSFQLFTHAHTHTHTNTVLCIDIHICVNFISATVLLYLPTPASLPVSPSAGAWRKCTAYCSAHSAFHKQVAYLCFQIRSHVGVHMCVPINLVLSNFLQSCFTTKLKKKKTKNNKNIFRVCLAEIWHVEICNYKF